MNLQELCEQALGIMDDMQKNFHDMDFDVTNSFGLEDTRKIKND